MFSSNMPQCVEVIGDDSKSNVITQKIRQPTERELSQFIDYIINSNKDIKIIFSDIANEPTSNLNFSESSRLPLLAINSEYKTLILTDENVMIEFLIGLYEKADRESRMIALKDCCIVSWCSCAGLFSVMLIPICWIGCAPVCCPDYTADEWYPALQTPGAESKLSRRQKKFREISNIAREEARKMMENLYHRSGSQHPRMGTL